MLSHTEHSNSFADFGGTFAVSGQCGLVAEHFEVVGSRASFGGVATVVDFGTFDCTSCYTVYGCSVTCIKCLLTFSQRNLRKHSRRCNLCDGLCTAHPRCM